MIDGPSPIDPLVAEGPLAPVGTLRPGPSLQRVLVLDGATPLMIDLADGNVRPYENGPPVSVPMVSNRFDLGAIERLQVQLLRDPRQTSVDSTLLSLHLPSAGRTIDVRETPDATLILDDGRSGVVTASIGSSPAVVIVIEPMVGGDDTQVVLRARNAETMDSSSITITAGSIADAVLTVGGPSTAVTSTFGRRRSIPVQIDVVPTREPAEQVRRVVRGAKRVAGSLRNRGA